MRERDEIGVLRRRDVARGLRAVLGAVGGEVERSGDRGPDEHQRGQQRDRVAHAQRQAPARRAGSVRMTAVASPVAWPERAVSMASTSSRSAISSRSEP
jgi:hypothetical protein